MNRISPRVSGIIVVLGGLCAALPFQKSARHEVAVDPAANSETIEWRSNDFTLEVTANDRPLTGSHDAEDRPKSPAFGGMDRVNVDSPASLDQVAQPPALADAYKPSMTAPRPAANGLRKSNGPPTGTRETAGGSPSAATTSSKSVAITHVISDGDTLEALAEKHLGSRLRWTEIYNANPEILEDPEVLPVGASIVILPGIRPATTSASSNETESLVPVSRSDLLKLRDAID